MQANREGAYGAPLAIGFQHCLGERRIAPPAPNLFELLCSFLPFLGPRIRRGGLCVVSVDPDCAQYVIVQGIREMGVDE